MDDCFHLRYLYLKNWSVFAHSYKFKVRLSLQNSLLTSRQFLSYFLLDNYILHLVIYPKFTLFQIRIHSISSNDRYHVLFLIFYISGNICLVIELLYPMFQKCLSWIDMLHVLREWPSQTICLGFQVLLYHTDQPMWCLSYL